MDSLIEIGASVVVIWELSGAGQARQRRALALIGVAFGLLAIYLAVQSSSVLAAGDRPRHSMAGIGWTAATATVMYALAAGKARTGAALGNPVLRAEGRVTTVDAVLATAVLTGLVLNAALGWWWADPARLHPRLLRRREKSATSSATTTPAQTGHLIPWENFRGPEPRHRGAPDEPARSPANETYGTPRSPTMIRNMRGTTSATPWPDQSPPRSGIEFASLQRRPPEPCA